MLQPEIILIVIILIWGWKARRGELCQALFNTEGLILRLSSGLIIIINPEDDYKQIVIIMSLC